MCSVLAVHREQSNRILILLNFTKQKRNAFESLTSYPDNAYACGGVYVRGARVPMICLYGIIGLLSTGLESRISREWLQ